MNLVRWTPTEPTPYEADPFFRRLFDWADSVPSPGPWYPRLDLVEEKERLLVQVELPGVDPKSVEVNLQGQLLTLQGERKEDRDETRAKVLKREHLYGSFQRSLKLPYRVLGDKTKAEYRNGILTITLPKADTQVGRQISIEVQK